MSSTENENEMNISLTKKTLWRDNMILNDNFDNHVFMIAQALVESGKHTNRYDLAREAALIAEAVTEEVERFVDNSYLTRKAAERALAEEREMADNA
tara:strand:+ start:740 stop:1030 length:291 start_codon:yes stop_codon:yes gene_type:complete